MHEDEIYGQIKAAIVGRRLPPGTRLAEEALAEAFGVSRTPMRNVLRRLAYERLVVIERNRGASVYCPTPDDAREVFDMRRILEDAVVERVVPRLAPADLARLAEIEAADLVAKADGDFTRAVRIGNSFHLELTRHAGNSLLARAVTELIDLSYVILALYGQKLEDMPHPEWHKDILAAFEARDVARSRAAMREHLDRLVGALDYSRPRTREIDFKTLFTGGEHPRQTAPLARRGAGRS